MAGTTGGLKHYRCKRFGYKFFLRRSAVNAAWFGITWCCFLLVVSLSITMNFPGTVIAFLMPLTSLVLPLYLYGVLVLGFAYGGMVRSCTSSRWWRNPAGAVALLFPLGGLVLAPLMLRRQQWWGAILSVLSLLLWIPVLWRQHEIPPCAVWGMIWGGILILLAAIAGWKERRRRQWRYLWPLAATGLYLTGMYAYSLNLERDLCRDRAAIAILAGHTLELSDFWNRQRQGLSCEAEPLRTLIATRPGKRGNNDADILSWLPAQPVTYYRHQAAAFQRSYPEFLSAATSFLTLPVQAVGHPQAVITFQVTMLELGAWRRLAVYLSCDLIAHASDPVMVRRRNAELEQVRDWCRADFALISPLVGMAVERMRLQALAYPLATGKFSPAAWQQLVGPEVDWNKSMAAAIGDEVTAFHSVYRYITAAQFKSSGHEYLLELAGGVVVAGQKYLPPATTIHLQRDYRFFLRKCLEFLQLLPAHNLTAEEGNRLKLDETALGNNFFLLSAMLLPALDNCYFKIAAGEDFQRLALMAGQVEQYRRKHGGLPDALSFLPRTQGSLRHLPVIYEHGDLEVNSPGNKVTTRYGFRLYLLDRDGRDPGGMNAENAFTVLLPRPGEPPQ
ncbi:MAG: hypothetical protein PHQ27_07225 [Victivallales bacterium]|nr:hypothetical protein [Victivallales bacterium]